MTEINILLACYGNQNAIISYDETVSTEYIIKSCGQLKENDKINIYISNYDMISLDFEEKEKERIKEFIHKYQPSKPIINIQLIDVINFDEPRKFIVDRRTKIPVKYNKFDIFSMNPCPCGLSRYFIQPGEYRKTQISDANLLYSITLSMVLHTVKQNGYILLPESVVDGIADGFIFSNLDEKSERRQEILKIAKEKYGERSFNVTNAKHFNKLISVAEYIPSAIFKWNEELPIRSVTKTLADHLNVKMAEVKFKSEQIVRYPASNALNTIMLIKLGENSITPDFTQQKNSGMLRIVC